jgi:peptidoglycan/xylan/chitin deacetylase (PgdA/CDA1 family)
MLDSVETTCAPVVPAKLSHSSLREGATWGLARVAAGLHGLLGDRLQSGFGILMYHRVADRTPGLAAPTFNVTPQHLREQLAGLLARGFEPWSLRRLVASQETGEAIPRKAFAVTFDDGYENNLLHALPILQEFKVPATIFLATAFLGSQQAFPSDVWSLAGSSQVPAASWRLLSIEQCHTLQESGLVDLGAHTHTHRVFANRAELFREDLARSVDILNDEFGVRKPTFAFPFGIATPELIEVARESNVSCALSTRSECILPGTDPFHWGRFTVDDSDTPPTLAAKIDGWYTVVTHAARSIKASTVGSRATRMSSQTQEQAAASV